MRMLSGNLSDGRNRNRIERNIEPDASRLQFKLGILLHGVIGVVPYLKLELRMVGGRAGHPLNRTELPHFSEIVDRARACLTEFGDGQHVAIAANPLGLLDTCTRVGDRVQT